MFGGGTSLSRINEWAHRTCGDSALSLDETHPGHQEVRQWQARVGASSVRRGVCSPAKSDAVCRVKGSEQPPEGRGKHPLGRAGLTVLQHCLPSRLQARQPGGFLPCSGAESRSEVGKFARCPGMVQPSAAWCEEAGGGRVQSRRHGGTTQAARAGPRLRCRETRGCCVCRAGRPEAQLHLLFILSSSGSEQNTAVEFSAFPLRSASDHFLIVVF